MPRFVVLHHSCPAQHPRPTHYDVMFEVDAALRTWALPAAPDTAERLIAERLEDHRLDYLDYQGPVSENRGTVTRWGSGDYVITAEGPGRLVVELRGDKLCGEAELTQLAEQAQRWSFIFRKA